MKTRNPAYVIWAGMKQRCLSPSHHAFKDYGGRGITIHPSWVGPGGFERFIAYVGERPGPEFSIDRFPNNDGNYEPGNVRWATDEQQNRNTRRNRLLTFRGETLAVAEWSERLGLSRTTIFQRLDSLGWDVERTLTVPMRADRRRGVVVIDPESTKVCRGCGVEKRRTEFHTDPRASDNRTSRCKACRNAEVAAVDTPENKRKRQRAYRLRKAAGLKLEPDELLAVLKPERRAS